MNKQTTLTYTAYEKNESVYVKCKVDDLPGTCFTSPPVGTVRVYSEYPDGGRMIVNASDVVGEDIILEAKKLGYEMAKLMILPEAKGGMNGKEFFRLFQGYQSAGQVLEQLSFEQVNSMMAHYDEHIAIRPGDIVTDNGRAGKWVVVATAEEIGISDVAYIRSLANNVLTKTVQSDLVKVGKHIDIAGAALAIDK